MEGLIYDLHSSHEQNSDSNGIDVGLENSESILSMQDVRTIDSLAASYAELLGRTPWHWFCTLTFRPHFTSGNGGVHPERADKAFRFFISKINRGLYGANWGKKHHRGLMWARGSEFHKDGRLHFHAVVSAFGNDLSLLTKRYDWHEFWYKEFGRNQIEVPRSQDEVTGYVSKYVSKDGLVDFSDNYGAWQPPHRNYEVMSRQLGNLIPI